MQKMQTLLSEGVPPNVVDEDGNTPLHKACEGETECVRALLVAMSGKLTRRNNDNNTPLMAAITYEDATIVGMLLAGGAVASEEAIALAKQLDVPEVIRALTNEDIADRKVKQRSEEDADFRRVSVSGENIGEYTAQFTNEKEVRRASLAGGAAQTGEAAVAAALVPEKPDEEDEGSFKEAAAA